MPRVIVIGGGIAGLSAAYYLAKGGVGSTIVESRPRLGGVISTERVEGCTLEAGPDSFLAIKPAALELLGELGLAGEVIGSNDHVRKTFVRKDGRLVALPDGLMMMVPTKILPLVATRLVGPATKLRMAFELLRSPRPAKGDQSVAAFVAEHYGEEAVEYLAEPLLSGVYGGDPRDLSVASVLPRFVELANRYGSLTRGVLAERARAAKSRHGGAGKPQPLFRTLKGGLSQMVAAIETALEGKAQVRHGRAETVERTGAGFRVRIAGEWLESDELVVACEAHSAAALLETLEPRVAALLGEIPYTSSMTVALGFDAADFDRPPEGFGFLVPRKERRRLMACTWVGTKFNHRVPEGKIVARCFMAARDAEALSEPDDVVVPAIASELREIAGITAVPRFARVFRWPRSMAQYTVGHGARLAEIQSRTAEIPGLYLAGNAYEGIGVPDCIRLGRRAAESILHK